MSEVTHFTEPVHPDAVGRVEDGWMMDGTGSKGRFFYPMWPEAGPPDRIVTERVPDVGGYPSDALLNMMRVGFGPW